MSPSIDPLPVPEAITDTSFSPTPPPAEPQTRRWWASHLAELRWQAELARLLVDPVYRGIGVPHG